MTNVYADFDKYSQEDFLYYKLKPVDIKAYSCAYCGKDVDEIICVDYCKECGEYLHVVEVS